LTKAAYCGSVRILRIKRVNAPGGEARMCGSLEPLRPAAPLRGGLAGLDRAGFAGLVLPGWLAVVCWHPARG
jgi:hypothetical protein